MKLKDYVTLGNLLSGFGSVIALMQQRFDWACYMIYIAYLFDITDGPVARLTKQFDDFGAAFDSVCDYVVNSICSSFLIYFAFLHYARYPWWAAAFVSAWPVAFGTIRQALGQVNTRRSYPCYWLGLPRPVATLFIVALLQSSLFPHDGHGAWGTWLHAVAALLVMVLSVLHVTTLPFTANHKRRWTGILRFGKFFFLLGSPLSLVVALLVFDTSEYFFDYVLFSLSIYIFLSWVSIPKTDLKRIKDYLAGGELVKPLVHVDVPWRPRSLLAAGLDPLLSPEDDARLR